ncbi:hypothetical protein DSO57_1008629 [Entomophthora muscae]|uniref:Uncharacterized protein n=1 Tax=Entomophthora muscae TaxID=34485 RepID=A0ACC2TUP8_9FUNG|nr:hypothetical protein DSO57_1008629 [Entomophthora muscae]
MQGPNSKTYSGPTEERPNQILHVSTNSPHDQWVAASQVTRLTPGSNQIMSPKTEIDSNCTVVIHMCAVLQVRVDLASNKDDMLKSDNLWLAGGAAWLVGNKGLPEADVASTQQKMLAALGYSASPSRELWLQEGEV